MPQLQTDMKSACARGWEKGFGCGTGYRGKAASEVRWDVVTPGTDATLITRVWAEGAGRGGRVQLTLWAFLWGWCNPVAFWALTWCFSRTKLHKS